MKSDNPMNPAPSGSGIPMTLEESIKCALVWAPEMEAMQAGSIATLAERILRAIEPFTQNAALVAALEAAQGALRTAASRIENQQPELGAYLHAEATKAYEPLRALAAAKGVSQ